MPRWFFVLASLLGLAAIASFVLTAPDPLGTVLAKLGEGGLWTGLAVFLVFAVILGYARRGTDRGTDRGSSPPRG